MLCVSIVHSLLFLSAVPLCVGITVIHLPVEEHLGFPVFKYPHTNFCVNINFYGSAMPYVKHMLDFIRNSQSIFQKVCVTLFSHQPIRVPVAPQSYQNMVEAVISMLIIVTCVKWYLIELLKKSP